MGLSTELIRQIGHHEDIQKLTFWALTLQQSERNLLSQRANTRNVRFWIIFFMVANSPYNQLCWKIQILCFTSPVTQHHHHHSFFRKNSFTLSIGLICCVKRSWYKVSALSWRFVRQEPLLATINSSVIYYYCDSRFYLYPGVWMGTGEKGWGSPVMDLHIFVPSRRN